MKMTHLMRHTNIGKIYCNRLTVPPAASIADFAFPLIAFTLKLSVAFISPLPSILTLSVRLMRPFMYRFSGDTSVNPYFSANWPICPMLNTRYSTLCGLLKPRLGNLLCMGIWPPSWAILFLNPLRLWWPLLPFVDVPP